MSRRLLFIGEFLIIDVSYPVKKMLDYGVDPNLANDDGLTSLHQVSRVSLRSGLTYLSKYVVLMGSCFESLQLSRARYLSANFKNALCLLSFTVRRSVFALLLSEIKFTGKLIFFRWTTSNFSSLRFKGCCFLYHNISCLPKKSLPVTIALKFRFDMLYWSFLNLTSKLILVNG